MTIKLNRRKFVSSGLAVSAGTAATLAGSGALDLVGGGSNDTAITAILKRRLPNISFDEQSLQAYSSDLLQRLSESRNRDGQAFAGTFKSNPDSRQLEHFIVQDFLVNSDALTAAQHQRAVTYTG